MTTSALEAKPRNKEDGLKPKDKMGLLLLDHRHRGWPAQSLEEPVPGVLALLQEGPHMGEVDVY